MKPLSRRTLLRGAGTLMALPMLEAMMPRRASAAPATPRRMLAFYVPCGINMAQYTPATTGASWEPTQILQPLIDAGLKNDVMVVTGLANRPAKPDGPGDHASGTGAFITAAHPFKTAAADISNGISVDQVFANAVGMNTRFPSLQLGVDAGGNSGDCDSGYSCSYAHNISWASATQPIAKETNPQSAFDRLFGGIDPNSTAQAIAKRKLYKQSILDAVKGDTTRLQGSLGSTDKRKLDEFLSGVRELETRIQSTMPSTCAPGTRPEAFVDIRDHVTQMLDMVAFAFQCDLTRSVSFMTQNAGSNYTYDFLGMTDGHHTISHHGGDPTKLANLAIIDTWEVKQYGYLLSKLKAIQEADGSVLDNSLCFFSSEIEDGNTHSHLNMPILVSGKAGGNFSPGRHVKYDNAPTVANLFVAMLNGLGVPTTSFGDSDTTLSGLKI